MEDLAIHLAAEPFPFSRPPLAPPASFAGLRRQPGLTKARLWNGSEAWVATRYDDVRTLLADNRFSANPRTPGFPNISPSRVAVTASTTAAFIQTDPPVHTRIRRMLTAEFTHARVEATRDIIYEIVNQRVDEMIARGAPADFMQDIAFALPTTVILRLMGLPMEDAAFFREGNEAVLKLDTPPEQAASIMAGMRANLMERLHEKARVPADDMMGRLVTNHVITGNLSFEEACAACDLLVSAGHETTANMAGLGMLTMLADPVRYAALRGNPELVRTTVEEMLRYYSVVQYSSQRVALEDVTHGDVTIRAGEGVLLLIAAANHDARHFPEPERFDMERASAMPHMAFGFGVHQCLGQALARLELRAVFETLPERLPTLRLAVPMKELDFKGPAMVHGVTALPVAW